MFVTELTSTMDGFCRGMVATTLFEELSTTDTVFPYWFVT